MKQKKVIIVGAGFGGLSAAASLSRDGFDVTVIEKNDQVGGRAGILKIDGYSFDMGPSWYLMPEVFEHFFSRFNKKPTDFYKLVKLDPSYRAFFGDDDSIDVSPDIGKNLEIFKKYEKDGDIKLKKYLADAEYKYNVALNTFLYRDYRYLSDLFDKRLILEGTKLRLFENLDRFTKRFIENEKLRQLLQYSIVFLGGAPKNTPALYSLISHVDFTQGVYYPMGGYGAVVKGIQNLAESFGTKFILNEPVTSIIIKDKNAVGVKTKNNEYHGDIIVMNADYHHAETKLLPPEYQTYPESYWQKRTVAPSAFILYLGLNKKIPGLEHHNIFIDRDWIKHFDAIFENPSWPTSPSYYVSVPSKTDPSVAPADGENVFILVPVASGLTDTPEIRQSFRKQILDHLEQKLQTTIRDAIVVEQSFAHNDYISYYNAFKGTALGISHTMFQTAVFRPHHQSHKVGNLFYTGQYTHPGIGVPITLISSEIVSDQIAQKYD
ncbi:phytoene desaturase [candidate division WWE3 bacterium]|nr:phytoene desaturase [candidate division WWE3 bacterium]